MHWGALLFIAGYHAVLFIGLPIYLFARTPGLDLLALMALLWAGTLVAITMGYHRFYSHKTYRASKILEIPLLFFGTAAIQGSALKWAFDHRLHQIRRWGRRSLRYEPGFLALPHSVAVRAPGTH